jgi:hypothetical protein
MAKMNWEKTRYNRTPSPILRRIPKTIRPIPTLEQARATGKKMGIEQDEVDRLYNWARDKEDPRFALKCVFMKKYQALQSHPQ